MKELLYIVIAMVFNVGAVLFTFAFVELANEPPTGTFFFTMAMSSFGIMAAFVANYRVAKIYMKGRD